MRGKISILVSVSAVLVVINQNCGKVDFAKETKASVSCVPGKVLGVYLDNAEHTYLGQVTAYSGSSSAVENYNYGSSSAHPLHGPTPSGYELHVFFYEDPSGISLNFYANVDASGSTDNEFSLRIKTTGNALRDRVLFVDDPDQDAASGGDYIRRSVSGQTATYESYFHYWSNTDGGIIGPFQGSDYSIAVEFVDIGDTKNARFYSADGRSFLLNDGPNASPNFIIRYQDVVSCP